MPSNQLRSSLSERLTSRRGARLSIVIALLLFVALFGVFGRATVPSGNDAAPPSSESTQVSELLAEFPDAGEQSVLVVATRDDGAPLTEADLGSMDGLRPAIDGQTGHEATEPRPSEDGEAAVIQTPVTIGTDNAQTADEINALRTEIGAHPVDGLTLQVTGGPRSAPTSPRPSTAPTSPCCS